MADWLTTKEASNSFRDTVSDYNIVNIRSTHMIEQYITPKQHGFMQKRLTYSNLMGFVHFSLNLIHVSAQIDCLYTDLSKVFNKVNHSKLIIKQKKIPSNMPGLSCTCQ